MDDAGPLRPIETSSHSHNIFPLLWPSSSLGRETRRRKDRVETPSMVGPGGKVVEVDHERVVIVVVLSGVAVGDSGKQLAERGGE